MPRTTLLRSTIRTGEPWGGATRLIALYKAENPNVDMNAGSLLNNGGSEPHNNMQPFLTMNFIIALQGLYPSRS